MQPRNLVSFTSALDHHQQAAVSTTWSNAMEAQPWVLNKNLQVIFTLCMVKVQSKQGMEATAECNSRTDFWQMNHLVFFWHHDRTSCQVFAPCPYKSQCATWSLEPSGCLASLPIFHTHFTTQWLVTQNLAHVAAVQSLATLPWWGRNVSKHF